MNSQITTAEMTDLLKSMPASSELEGIIKDAADDGASDHCSWAMASRAAEAVEKRLQTVERFPASYRNALLWAFDRLSVTGGMDAAAQRRTMQEIGNVLRGRRSPAATYQPNDWDDSAALQEAGR